MGHSLKQHSRAGGSHTLASRDVSIAEYKAYSDKANSGALYLFLIVLDVDCLLCLTTAQGPVQSPVER